jgi:hypothetical protein
MWQSWLMGATKEVFDYRLSVQGLIEGPSSVSQYF